MAGIAAFTRPRSACIALVLGALVSACTGELDLVAPESPDGGGSPGISSPDASAAGGAMVVISGPPVVAHAQAFANAACDATGACQVSTYEGHDPTAARALDTLVSNAFGTIPTDGNALGEAHAAFALAHQTEFGIMYVIFRQRYNDGSGWSPMEDRGSITQNHYDHVHVSFNETAP